MSLILKQKFDFFKLIKKKQYDKIVDYYVKENKSYCLQLPFTKVNLNFLEGFLKCEQCGYCCTKLKSRKGNIQHIQLVENEPRIIAKWNGLNEKIFKEFYCKEIKGKWYLKSPCFLYDKNNKKCKTYNVRPTVCRMFPLQNPKKIKFEGMEYLAITFSPHCPAVRNFLTEQWFPGLINYTKLIQEDLRKQKKWLKK